MTRDFTTVATRYANCIDDFISAFVNTPDDNVRAIVMHGGLVRDPAPIERWSDIDLILVLRHYSDRVTPFVSELVDNLERKHDVRLDVNLLYESDFDQDHVKARFYHSEIINALNQRGTRILYGSLGGSVALFNEHEAVYVYLNTVQNLFRRYYIENVYRPKHHIKDAAYIQRIIRWVFSIIRSSLRLRGIYANPYHESLSELMRLDLVSAKDVELLENLMGIRNDLRDFDSMSEEQVKVLYASIERFVERYIHEVVHGS